ncbi:MAG: nucleoside kinase, partial [Treponema sp.]|nr:nucleoside kinase [Treponema sp.]
MKTITLTFPSGERISVPSGTRAITLLNHFSEPKEHIFAVMVNNETTPLDQPLSFTAHVEPIIDASKEGAAVYRRSLCLLLGAAAHTVFPGSRLLVGHSLGHGYYYTLDTGVQMNSEDITALEAEMRQLVAKDVPIETDSISYEEALTLFETIGVRDARKQLNYFCPPFVRINTIDAFSDMYFGPLVPSTGYLKTFEIKQYGEGFLLRFPNTSQPHQLTEFRDQPKLFAVYQRYKDWGKRLGVTSAADLNELVANRTIDDFITITETLQEKTIADIADQIAARNNVRVVLIAGPSSSGKTTTSKKLALELRAIGYTPKIISLDSYYVGRERNPKDENGNYDYECLEALDIEFLNQSLLDLFNGKEIAVPSYNFTSGTRYFEDKHKMQLHEHDILIMEGIHGLNDKLTPLIDTDLKFKVYISALTQLNLDDHTRIATRDNRLIRRIVRDSRFRGKSAAATISMWPSVQRGEQLHIFPFQNNADAILNTALDYEIAVLKVYADPLLRCVSPL